MPRHMGDCKPTHAARWNEVWALSSRADCAGSVRVRPCATRRDRPRALDIRARSGTVTHPRITNGIQEVGSSTLVGSTAFPPPRREAVLTIAGRRLRGGRTPHVVAIPPGTSICQAVAGRPGALLGRSQCPRPCRTVQMTERGRSERVRRTGSVERERLDRAVAAPHAQADRSWPSVRRHGDFDPEFLARRALRGSGTCSGMKKATTSDAWAEVCSSPAAAARSAANRQSRIGGVRAPGAG
jgi:hypothetical protein